MYYMFLVVLTPAWSPGTNPCCLDVMLSTLLQQFEVQVYLATCQRLQWSGARHGQGRAYTGSSTLSMIRVSLYRLVATKLPSVQSFRPTRIAAENRLSKPTWTIILVSPPDALFHVFCDTSQDMPLDQSSLCHLPVHLDPPALIHHLRSISGNTLFISCLMTIHSNSLRQRSLCLLFCANSIFDHINRVDILCIYCSVPACSVLDHVNHLHLA